MKNINIKFKALINSTIIVFLLNITSMYAEVSNHEIRDTADGIYKTVNYIWKDDTMPDVERLEIVIKLASIHIELRKKYPKEISVDMQPQLIQAMQMIYQIRIEQSKSKENNKFTPIFSEGGIGGVKIHKGGNSGIRRTYFPKTITPMVTTKDEIFKHKDPLFQSILNSSKLEGTKMSDSMFILEKYIFELKDSISVIDEKLYLNDIKNTSERNVYFVPKLFMGKKKLDKDMLDYYKVESVDTLPSFSVRNRSKQSKPKENSNQLKKLMMNSKEITTSSSNEKNSIFIITDTLKLELDPIVKPK